METEEPTLWEPEDGRTRTEWMNHNGMTADVYQEVKALVTDFKVMELMEDGRTVSVAIVGSGIVKVELDVTNKLSKRHSWIVDTKNYNLCFIIMLIVTTITVINYDDDDGDYDCDDGDGDDDDI